MVSTGQDVYDYLKSTLCFKLSEGDEEKENLVKSKIRAILQQKLERNGLIRWVKEEGGKGGIWAPTTLGKAAALSSMPPDKALRLKNDIEAAVRCLNLENDLHLVYLVVQVFKLVAFERTVYLPSRLQSFVSRGRKTRQKLVSSCRGMRSN